MQYQRLAMFAILSSGIATASCWADDHSSGDAANGATLFKLCQACHVVKNDAGEVLAGRSAKTGPNLYQLAGRTAGSVAGYNYSKSLSQAGEAGLNWTEASFVAYVADPSGFLKAYLGDNAARGRMSFKLRNEADAADLFAFLAKTQ